MRIRVSSELALLYRVIHCKSKAPTRSPPPADKTKHRPIMIATFELAPAAAIVGPENPVRVRQIVTKLSNTCDRFCSVENASREIP